MSIINTETKKRTARPLDEDGKLVLYPGSGAETFKMANNSTSTHCCIANHYQEITCIARQISE